MGSFLKEHTIRWRGTDIFHRHQVRLPSFSGWYKWCTYISFPHRFSSPFWESFSDRTVPFPSVQRPVSKCLCRGFTVYLFHACVFQSFVPLVSRHCCESKFLSPVLNSGRAVNRFPIHQGSHFVVFLHDLNIIQIVMHAD